MNLYGYTYIYKYIYYTVLYLLVRYLNVVYDYLLALFYLLHLFNNVSKLLGLLGSG